MRKSKVLDQLVRRRANVILKSGVTFQGVIAEQDHLALILVNSALLGEHEATAVDGQLFVLTGDVAYIQLL